MQGGLRLAARVRTALSRAANHRSRRPSCREDEPRRAPPTSILPIRSGASQSQPTDTGHARPRHLFRFRRDTQGGNAKDALYGGYVAAPRQAPARDEHEEDPGVAYLRRLKGAYDQLAAEVPSVPRDADGNTNERAVLQLLAEQGLELSLDG